MIEILNSLTDQETRVLKLFSSGLSNSEIAEKMALSESTIHRHYMTSIYRKFGISGGVGKSKCRKLLCLLSKENMLPSGSNNL